MRKIPYDFEVQEMEDNYYQLKEKVQTKRKNYEIMLDKNEKLKKEVLEKYSIQNIKFPISKNEAQV